MVCPWPFMTALDSSMDKQLNSNVNPPVSTKSFKQALAGAGAVENFLNALPPKVIMGNSVRVRI